MKRFRRFVRFLHYVEDAAIFFLSVSVFLVGLYAVYDSFLVYQKANDSSQLKYKPGYEGEDPKRRIKGNMVAWLTLDDTAVDYPVMQGTTNMEYLNQNPFGEYSLAGSIFLDSRNQSDFSDDYMLIYGHHMEGGMMFGALDRYWDFTYFKTHRTGSLVIGNDEKHTYEMQVLAIVEAQATNEAVFAPTDTDVAVTYTYIKKNAIFLDGDTWSKKTDKDKLIAMSTCKSPDAVDRTIVFALMKDRTPKHTERKGEN